MKKHVLFFLLSLASLMLNAQQIAFPGAEGFGRFATGARYGSVYRVTNLNDSGPGSFRDAVSQSNRFVVFDVSGVIRISSRVVVSSNVTIAGQTAPGDGITIYGNAVSFSGATNSICRYVRFRMGIVGDSGRDAVGVANGTDMMFDHISVSWGRDENFSISSDGGALGRITIQNSIIAQGLHTHSCGGLIQTDNLGVTLYRNLYIDNHTRNPKVKGLNQFVNNVIYNWGGGGGYILGDSAGDSWATILNNYFVKGPAYYENGDHNGKYSPTAPYSRANENFQLYAAGNYYDDNTNGILDGSLSQQADYGPAYWVPDLNSWNPLKPIPEQHPQIESEHASAIDAYSWIVANAGATLPKRDPVDEYLIDELTSLGERGTIINRESYLNLPNTVGVIFGAPQLTDTDQDGMPDAWETANGTDPNVNDAMTIAANGYANIENYCNSITEPIAFLRYPHNVEIELSDPQTAVLTWANTETQATEIILEKSTDRFTYTTVATLAADATTATVAVTADVPAYFRLKTTDGTRESLYSDVVKIYDDVTRPGGGTPGGTLNFLPQEGSYYRILNYGSTAYNSSANFSGAPKYLTVTPGGAIGSTATFEWDNPALVWEIKEDASGNGTFSIQNVGSEKYFASVSEGNVTQASDTENGGYSLEYAQDELPSQAGVSEPIAFYRLHSGADQFRPREFTEQWFWANGSVNRADMLFTLVPVDSEALSLFTGNLRDLILVATILANDAQIGPDLLQYPAEAKDDLLLAVATAQVFADNIDYSTTEQNEIDNATNLLQNAIENFNAQQNRRFSGYDPAKTYTLFSYGTASNSSTATAAMATARRYLAAIPNHDGTLDSLVYLVGKSENELAAGAVDLLQSQENAQWTLTASTEVPGLVSVQNKATGTYLQIGSFLSATPVEIYPHYQKSDNGNQAYSLQVSSAGAQYLNVGMPDEGGSGGPLEIADGYTDRTRLRWIFSETSIELAIENLDRVIAQSITLSESVQVGSQVLHYPAEAKQSLDDAIAFAQAFRDALNAASTQVDVAAAAKELEDAVQVFRATQIRTFADHDPEMVYTIFSYGTAPNNSTAAASPATARRYLATIRNFNNTRDSLVYFVGKSDNQIAAGETDEIQAQENAQWLIEASDTQTGFFVVKNKATGAYLQIDNYLAEAPAEIYPYYQKNDNGKHAYSLQVSDTNTRCFNVGNLNGSTGALAFANPADRTRLRWVFDEAPDTGLPVSWVSFTGTEVENQVHLNWVTASEINHRHFEVERSQDAIEFTKLGIVLPNESKRYRFTDEAPMARNYYRIRQVDYSGDVSFSVIISVDLKRRAEGLVRFMSNPVRQNLTIAYQPDITHPLKVSVYSMSGVLLKTVPVVATETTTLDLSALSGGLYVVKVEGKKQAESKLIVKD